MSDLVTGLRLNLAINKMGLWLMWVILGGILAVNIALYRIFSPETVTVSGALAALPSYCVVVGIITAARDLPFALMLGLTRLRYYLATLLAMVLLSGAWSAIAVGVGALEAATGGWGVKLIFFRISSTLVETAGQAFAVLFVALLLAFVVGWCFGTVHRRWGVIGVLLALGLVLLIVSGVIVVAAAPQVMPTLHRWLAELTVTRGLALAAGLAVLLAAAGWSLTRRAAV